MAMVAELWFTLSKCKHTHLFFPCFWCKAERQLIDLTCDKVYASQMIHQQKPSRSRERCVPPLVRKVWKNLWSLSLCKCFSKARFFFWLYCLTRNYFDTFLRTVSFPLEMEILAKPVSNAQCNIKILKIHGLILLKLVPLEHCWGCTGLSTAVTEWGISPPPRPEWSCTLVASGGLSDAHRGCGGLPADLRMAFWVKKSYFLVWGKTRRDFLIPFKALQSLENLSELLSNLWMENRCIIRFN